MSLLTTLTRMWLTRSVRPFSFTGGYDRSLPYDGCEKLGLYVHIPFCRSVCDFCPYCKYPYSPEQAGEYIHSLLSEIELVTAGHQKKTVSSLYFGGGTPALLSDRLHEVIAALERH